MITTKVKAIFKGQDGSVGYKNGQEYTLTVWQHPPSNNGHHSYIVIERIPNHAEGGYCEYETIGSFLSNWDCIRHIQ